VWENILLQTLNVRAVADLWEKRLLCAFLFTPRTASWFLRVCLCCTEKRDRVIGFGTSSSSRKSISTERTFRDCENPAELVDTCRVLCYKLAQQCQSKGIKGRTFTLKLKSSDFSIKSRQVSFSCAVPRDDTGEDLFVKAVELLKKEFPCRIRLMGVRLSQLESNTKRERAQAASGPIEKLLSSAMSSATPTRPSCAAARAERGPGGAVQGAPGRFENTDDGDGGEDGEDEDDRDGAGDPFSPCPSPLSPCPSPVPGSPVPTAQSPGIRPQVQVQMGSGAPACSVGAHDQAPSSASAKTSSVATAPPEALTLPEEPRASTSRNDACADGAGKLANGGRGGSATCEESLANVARERSGTDDPHADLSSTSCPICGVKLHTRDNLALNTHIDLCLNQGLLADDGMHQPRSDPPPPPPKRSKPGTLEAFFGAPSH